MASGKKKLAAVVAMMAAAAVALADLVSDEAIESAAKIWLSVDRVARMTMTGLSFCRLEHRGSLRIVHLSPSGYIVMSGYDVADPVVSFSRNGYVEPEEGSPFNAMLEHSDFSVREREKAGGVRTGKWTKLIGGRDGVKVPSAKRRLSKLSDSGPEEPSTILIEPFMKMLWNQWQPWNDFAPVYDPDANDQLYRARCPSGCVGTATAQQIAYCRWPWRTGRSDTWVHTLDADGEVEADGRYAESEFPVRFDGHNPFEWDAFLDTYTWWWGDARGKVAESERFPIARFFSWVETITKMNFGKSSSGANFGNTGDSTTDWYEKWEECNLENTNDYGVARIKADLEFGVPVHVGVPGHSVIAHGFASDGESYFLYLNYGWGGSADGWYKLYDSPIGGAFPGFRPKKMVQLEPLPKVSEGSFEVKWHQPPCHDGLVRGFEVVAEEFGNTLGDEVCDFTSSAGIASNPKAAYVTNNVDHIENDGDFVCENNTDFLWWNSYEAGTYDLPGERILTGRSVLSYRHSSSNVGDREVEILASFDGGEWQTVSLPLLNRRCWSKSWMTQSVFLGQHAGKRVKFRIKVSWAGGRLFFDDFKVSEVILPSVVFRATIAPNLRSCSLSGLGAGKMVGVTVKPLFDGGDGLISECQFTRIAGESYLALPGAYSVYETSDVVYTSVEAGGIWGLRGIAEGETSIRAHNAWSGGFDVTLPGILTEQSTLSFSWYEIGCYALDTEYDTISATFVDDLGVETDFWVMTNQNQQTERQLAEIPLAQFAGKSGGVKVVFGHHGVNYYGDGDIMRFYSPRVSNVSIPVLPEMTWESKGFVTLPLPRIDSVKGHDGMEIDEGLYREVVIGEDSLRVTCSKTVENLCAYPSHLSLMDDNDVSVEKIATGKFLVRMNAARVVRRSRMILTLAATDANGTTVYRDISLRFDTHSEVLKTDTIRKINSLANSPPVVAFQFENDMDNQGVGEFIQSIGGGGISYVESPLGYAIRHDDRDGPWSGSDFAFPGEWTILTIAKFSGVDNAVLFQFGSSSYEHSGFALASGGGDVVTLSHWMPDSQHVDLISVNVPDAPSKYHAYALRGRGNNVELFVDGILVGRATLPTLPEKGFQFFSVIQGDGKTGLTSASGECVDDWRMYSVALPDMAITAYYDMLFRIENGVFDNNYWEWSDLEGVCLYESVVGAVPSAAASIYEGYLYSGDGFAGTIQVKVGKRNNGSRLSSVKATVVGLGGKKTMLQATEKGKAPIADDVPTTVVLIGGEACEVTLGAYGMKGSYGAYYIDGARNLFMSKDASDKAVAAKILADWQGTVNVAWLDNHGWNGLSDTIASKGKVNVSGYLSDGAKLPVAKSQMLVGEKWCCAPVLAANRAKAGLAYLLWLPRDGQGIDFPGVIGIKGAVVDKPGSLKDGAAFRIDKAVFGAMWGKTAMPYLPNGVSVGGGAKWTLPKAGKVAYVRNTTEVDATKLLDNPSALKLTYKAKDGTFKGSFKSYAVESGKPKATTVNVIGVLVDGVGYGTASIKNVGSIPVTVE